MASNDLAGVVSRVHELFELAASDDVEAARAAAHAACALIREHRLLIMAVAPPPRAAPPETRRYDPPPRPAQQAARRGEATGPRRFTSKYVGRCIACRGGYDEGDTIWWMKGRGAAHDGCQDEVEWTP